MCSERVDSAQRPSIYSSLVVSRPTARPVAVSPATGRRSLPTSVTATGGCRGCRPSAQSNSTDPRPPRPTRERGPATPGSARPSGKASCSATVSAVSISIIASTVRLSHQPRPRSSLGCRPPIPRSHRAVPVCTFGIGCPRRQAHVVASTACRSRPTQGRGTSRSRGSGSLDPRIPLPSCQVADADKLVHVDCHGYTMRAEQGTLRER